MIVALQQNGVGVPYLVTWQHGGSCPGGAGPNQCRIIYRWDGLGGRLETEDRHLIGDERPTFDHGLLTGARPRCTPDSDRSCRR